MQKLKIAAAGIAVILLLAFANFVWPTRYRWDHLDGNPVKIDRITHEAEVLNPGGGWRYLGNVSVGYREYYYSQGYNK